MRMPQPRQVLPGICCVRCKSWLGQFWPPCGRGENCHRPRLNRSGWSGGGHADCAGSALLRWCSYCADHGVYGCGVLGFISTFSHRYSGRAIRHHLRGALAGTRHPLSVRLRLSRYTKTDCKCSTVLSLTDTQLSRVLTANERCLYGHRTVEKNIGKSGMAPAFFRPTRHSSNACARPTANDVIRAATRSGVADDFRRYVRY